MRTGFTLFALIGLGLVFKADIWPKSTDVKLEHYSYVTLSSSDSIKAIDNYRKSIHLVNTGFHVDFFPFSEQKLTKKMHVWFILTFVTLIIVVFLWSFEASKDSKIYVIAFLVFSIGKLVNYLLMYNDEVSKGMSYNMIAVVSFGVFLLSQILWKEKY